MKYLLLVTIFLLSGCATVGGDDEFAVATRSDADRRAGIAVLAGVYGMCLEMAPVSHCRSLFDEEIEKSTANERREYSANLNRFIDSYIEDPANIDFDSLDEIFIE